MEPPSNDPLAFSLTGTNTTTVPPTLSIELGVACNTLALCFGIKLLNLYLPYHNNTDNIEVSLGVQVDDALPREYISAQLRGDHHDIHFTYTNQIEAGTYDSCFIQPPEIVNGPYTN